MEPMDAHKRDLESRFDSVGWGLLFLFLAALAIPQGTAEYVAVAVIGGLMLLLNAIRVTLDVSVSWFSVILGSAMLAAGGGALTGVHMDFFALIFVIAGVVTISGALLRPPRATAG